MLTNIIFKVKLTQKFTPNLRIVNSSSTVNCNPLSDFSFKIKPNVSVYCANTDPKVIMDSTLAEIFIKFKCNSGDNSFCDLYNVSFLHCGDQNGTKSFLHETKSSNNTLGQITSYTAQLGSQYCTHVYSIFIMKDTAKILQCDKLGIIVIEVIEYNEFFVVVVEFFHCYLALGGIT